MSAIKRYIEEEAERLGVTFDEVVAAHKFLHPTPDDSETLCPQCSSPMEHQASEAPNNAGSDAEWYQCPTCDYETEVN